MARAIDERVPEEDMSESKRGPETTDQSAADVCSSNTVRPAETLVLAAGSDPGGWKLVKRALAGRFTVAYSIDLAGTLELLARERPTVLLLCSALLDTSTNACLKSVTASHPDLKVIVLGAASRAAKAYDNVVYLGASIRPSDLLSTVRELCSEDTGACPPEEGGEVDLPAYREMVIGSSPSMRRAVETLRRVAKVDVTVLLSGESGTGKELFARRLHCLSGRARGPFRAVNLPAVPGELFESVLFGHERGAFTGATEQRAGVFEQAHKGTLFLDEIASTDIVLQSKLLRTIQEGEFERVGGQGPTPCDTRIVAATNVDLVEAVKRKEFREDLYHRLSVIVIDIPPLRRRAEDIPFLVEMFCKKYAQKFGIPTPEIESNAISSLQKCEWQGNVRELENRVQRALLLARGDKLQAEDFLEDSQGDEGAWRIHFGGCEHSLEQVEHAYIAQVLERHEGNQSKAAQVLGIDRKTLRAKRQRAVDFAPTKLLSV